MSGSWRCECAHIQPKHDWRTGHCHACTKCGMSADQHKFLGCASFRTCGCTGFRETTA